MHTYPDLPPDDVLRRSAKLKADGASWESISRTLDTPVHDFDGVYLNADWQRLYRLARLQVERELHDESVHTTRKLLRHEDPKFQLKAAELSMKLKMTRIRHRPKKVVAKGKAEEAKKEPWVDPAPWTNEFFDSMPQKEVEDLLTIYRNNIDLENALQARAKEWRERKGITDETRMPRWDEWTPPWEEPGYVSPGKRDDDDADDGGGNVPRGGGGGPRAPRAPLAPRVADQTHSRSEWSTPRPRHHAVNPPSMTSVAPVM